MEERTLRYCALAEDLDQWCAALPECSCCAHCGVRVVLVCLRVANGAQGGVVYVYASVVAGETVYRCVGFLEEKARTRYCGRNIRYASFIGHMRGR